MLYNSLSLMSLNFSPMTLKNTLLSIFCLFGLTPITTLRAQQDVWSLERCVNYALENNIMIKQQEIGTKYSKNNLTQSVANLLPNLNASGGYSHSEGRALDNTTYQFNPIVNSVNASISSSITLFSGFQKVNTVRQNKIDLLASLQDLQKLKNDISLNIAAAYLQILFNEELLAIQKSQQDITRQQVDRTGKLVDAGSLPRGNLLEIQAQYATEEVQVVNAKNQLDLSYLTLTQFLDLDSVGNFRIEIPAFGDITAQGMPSSLLDVYLDAEQKMPQVKSAEYKLHSSEVGLSMAYGSLSPRVSLSYYYGSNYSDASKKQVGTDSLGIPIFGDYTFNNQFRDNTSSTVTAGVSIPIFNGLMNATSISNAKLAIANSKLTLENTKNILYKDIQQAYADALAALNKYNASEKSLTAQKESFKYTQQKFEVGLVNTVDFNTAKNTLARTESDLLQAKYDYLFRINILNFYRGMPITIK
jgi:outer membrane protein